MKPYHVFILLFLFVGTRFCSGQIDTLETIKISVQPSINIEGNLLRSPFSISSILSKKSLESSQQLTLSEYLENVPGLFTLSSYNFSQDLRISIRGFGARSAFGIRGIKIVVDGIPETTPDGQGQIDNLTLSIVDHLQVLRGPASLLYGNASGGTINIQTLKQIDSSFAQAGFTIGNYGMNKIDILAGVNHSNGSTIISGSRTSTNGYRDHSEFETNQLNVRTILNLDAKSDLSFQLNYTDSPVALDAGGLTIDEVNQDRRQARSRNVDFDSREQVRQVKTGVAYSKKWNHLGLNSYGFYSYRDFDNKLPFESGGQVELYRNYYGQGSYLTYDSNGANYQNKVQLGYALAWQADQRQRFDNVNGDRGPSDFNQLESFNSYGFYLIDSFEISKWVVQGGLRYDMNRLKAEDKTLNNNSSEQDLNSWSGSLGINYSLDDYKSVFANLSTSFETPALSELSSNPNGGTGFNTDLKPQTAINYEVGYKQNTKNFQWNAALFFIETKDDLVPFELQQFPNRTFYRNAGSTNRYGLELYGDLKLTQNISTQASYTYSDFSYDQYIVNGNNFDDKSLPGIPKNMVTLGFTYQPTDALFLRLNSNYRGSLYADDANLTSVDNAIISNFSFSYVLNPKKAAITFIGGINNLFDTKYYDNVRINAFGNRYYEPAPSVNVYTGIKIRI